jgi:hypothetical protein
MRLSDWLESLIIVQSSCLSLVRQARPNSAYPVAKVRSPTAAPYHQQEPYFPTPAISKKRQWFSGKIHRCHRWAPRSIRGWRNKITSFFGSCVPAFCCWLLFVCPSCQLKLNLGVSGSACSCQLIGRQNGPTFLPPASEGAPGESKTRLLARRQNCRAH